MIPSPRLRRRKRRPLLVVLRAGGLGDLLTAVPALRGLARAFPEHTRVLAGPAALAPLLGLVHDDAGGPVLDAIVDAAPLAPIALATAPDVAVNLHDHGPQSHRIMLALGPRRLIAFRHLDVPRSGRGAPWSPHEHEVGRWCRMLAHAGVPCQPHELGIFAPPLPPGLHDAGVTGATLLHPGAGSAARRWPLARWAEVARLEAASGRRVLVTGGAQELGLARELASRAGLPADAVLAGRTDVRELAACVAAAGRVACADTGVAHLATALGTPSVVLFGAESPAAWGPPAARREHVAIWRGQRGSRPSGAVPPKADTPDPGLLAIGVEDVAQALAALPRSRSRSREQAPAGEYVQVTREGGVEEAAGERTAQLAHGLRQRRAHLTLSAERHERS